MTYPIGKFSDDEIRAQIAQFSAKCWASRWIGAIYPYNVERFDQIITEYNCDISKKFPKQAYILAYFTNNLTRCEVCGKSIIKPKIVCSSVKCQGASPTVKTKRINSIKERYGVENVFQIEAVKERAKKTCLQKYGVEWYTQTDEHQQLLRETNTQAAPEMRAQINAKIRKTMFERYGVEHHEYLHISNLENYNDQYILEHFLDGDTWKFTEVQEYFNLSRRGAKARLMRINPEYKFPQCNKSQHELFELIPTKNKHENDRTIIAPQELDIVLPDIKLAIEYNGVYWHSTVWKDSRYHLDKTEKAEAKGWQLFQIFEGENLNKWISLIKTKLGQNKRISARTCKVVELASTNAFKFCDTYHIQGGVHAKVNYGLVHDGELVQVMTFSKPRFNKKYEYELVRLCTKQDLTIVGGASKLLAHFIRDFNPSSIVSYANRRFSTGNIYERLGFERIGTTEPSYCWCNGTELLSRMQTQRHKLGDYPKTMSESDIMQQRGFWKLYDCGNIVYAWHSWHPSSVSSVAEA